MQTTTHRTITNETIILILAGLAALLALPARRLALLQRRYSSSSRNWLIGQQRLPAGFLFQIYRCAAKGPAGAAKKA